MFGNWMKLGLDWTMLAIESQYVVALRIRLIDEIQKDLYAL
jgi:hypothetical protein